MNQIIQFLIAHGGLILFAVALSEQIGLPLPGAPWFIAAGALAASGKINLLAAIGWTALGCVAADAILFFIGDRGRARVFRVFPHLHSVQVKLERATLARNVLHGTRVLTLAKFIPLGQIVSVHAGAMQVNRLRFLLVDAFSSAVYAAVYASLGYAFRDQLEQLVAFLHKLGTISIVVIAFLAGAYVVYAFRKHRPASRKTQAALI
jgi:membrane protein DedA with SNARE-associated domain